MARTSSRKSGLLWSAVNNWTYNLLSFAVVSILARIVAPEEFGVLGLAGIFIALCQVIVGEPVSHALVQRPRLDDAHLQSAFWVMTVVGLALWAVGIAIAPAAAAYFAEPHLTLVLQIFAARLVFDALQTVPVALLLRHMDFKTLAVRSFFANAIGGGVGIAIALAGGGVWALVVQQLTNAVVTFVVCMAHLSWRPRPVFSFRHARELLPFSVLTMLTQACYFAAFNFDRLLVGHVAGTTAVGYYGFARRIQEVASSSLTGVVSSFTFPLFAGVQSDRARLSTNLFTVAGYTAIVTFPAFAALAVAAPDVVPLLFGRKWSPSAVVIEVLALQGIVLTMAQLHNSVIRALGRARWGLLVAGASGAMNLIGYLLAARYGLVAMAASTLAVSIFCSPIHWWMVWKLIPFRMVDYVRLCVGPLAASAVMALAMHLVRSSPSIEMLPSFARLGAELLFGAAVYGVLVAVFLKERAMRMIFDAIPSRRPA